MSRTVATFALALAGALTACGGHVELPDDAAIVDAAAIDAAIDAPPGPCGNGLTLAGQYLDWDSMLARFDGIEGAEWTVVMPAGGATATTSPDGRIVLCLTRNVTSQIDVTQPNYLPARFVADGPVFAASDVTFAVRGLAVGTGAAQFGEFGEAFNPSAAQVLVYKVGAPIPLALQPAINPPQRSYVSDGPDDTTWAAGAAGTLTLFPNRPVVGDVGSATLTSTSNFTGPATLPLVAGRLTITVIR